MTLRPALIVFAIVACAPRSTRAPAPPSPGDVTVTTLARGAPLVGPDGAAVGPDGAAYVANWGAGRGTTVVRLTSDGAVAVAHDGFAAPDGVAFDAGGALYVSNFASGEIHRIAPGGARTVYARGLDHPSALAFGPDGLLYVSNFGSYDGTTVSRVRADGAVETYAAGFAAPLGLAFDRRGDLYVSNFNSGVIHRVGRDRVPRVFASVPDAPPARLQYLAFDAQGTLYVPSYGHHRVYAVSTTGEVRVLAGDGTAGGDDGPGDRARFHGPNSIAVLPDGSLLVTEYEASRARRIVLPGGRR